MVSLALMRNKTWDQKHNDLFSGNAGQQPPICENRSNNVKYTVADGVFGSVCRYFSCNPVPSWTSTTVAKQKGRSNAHSLFSSGRNTKRSANSKLGRYALQQLFSLEDFLVLDRWVERTAALIAVSEWIEHLCIAMDGSSFFSSEKISCASVWNARPQWRGTFLSQRITPVFVKPVSPVLPCAWGLLFRKTVVRSRDWWKNGCKRWLAQHHERFSDHSVTYLRDDMYAITFVPTDYRNSRQFFIFVCKPESHPGLYWVALFWTGIMV